MGIREQANKKKWRKEYPAKWIGEHEMNNQLAVTGSMNDLAQRQKTSISAIAAMNAEIVLIVDSSGSMTYTDVEIGELAGMSRIDAAQKQLSALQRKHEGKVYIIEFNSTAFPQTSGILNDARGSTNLTEALIMAKPLNLAGLPVVVISDGAPDDENMPIHIIRDFTGGKVSAIYIGPKGGHGEEYLKRLVASAGNAGKVLESKGTGEFLEATEETLLLGG